ncbi:hypothetical protein [Nonomuraea maheshkhaliensis]
MSHDRLTRPPASVRVEPPATSPHGNPVTKSDLNDKEHLGHGHV